VAKVLFDDAVGGSAVVVGASHVEAFGLLGSSVVDFVADELYIVVDSSAIVT